MKLLICAGACTGLLLGLAVVPASATIPTAADDPVTKADVNRAVDQVPQLVKKLMRQTGVPGIAVAIVHKNKVIYTQGFGVRSTKSGEKVTPSTVFQLASVSKPIGASVVAAAVSDGIVKWTTPAVKHLPELVLADGWVTQKVTIGDLYAHRSGLPGNSGNDLELFGFDRNTIIERLRYEPLSPFRSSYSYSNFGMTTGGESVARAAGTSWEKLAKKKIFDPVGMTKSSFRYSDYLGRKNRAVLHQQVDGKWLPYSKREPDAQAPAGGLSSNVVDMADWLRMELALGKFGGERLIKKSALREALSMQIRNSPASDAAKPPRGYGFGMAIEMDSTGRVHWAHSGAFSAGAATRIDLIPDLDLGIVVLTNGWPIGVPEALTQQFTDLVEYGSLQQDWLKATSAAFGPLTAKTGTVFGKKQPKNPTPAKALSTYVGTYANDYVGDASVSEEGGKLVLRVGPNGETKLRLKHWDGDVFYYNSLDMPPGFPTGVEFDVVNGAAESVDLEDVNSGLGKMSRVLLN